MSPKIFLPAWIAIYENSIVLMASFLYKCDKANKYKLFINYSIFNEKIQNIYKFEIIKKFYYVFKKYKKFNILLIWDVTNIFENLIRLFQFLNSIIVIAFIKLSITNI